MNSGLLTPEEETYPNRYRWSVEACYRLKELGFLDGRFEILDGEVVNKMGQKPQHRIAIILLAEWLISLFGARRVQTEGPIALNSPDSLYSEPEPDVAVTREPTTAYAQHHPGPDDLLLVVEVSDTTLRTDLLVKARLYARAGIPEYWALDLKGRRLYVHREPANGEYASVTVVGESEQISPLGRPEEATLLSALLAPDEPESPDAE